MSSMERAESGAAAGSGPSRATLAMIADDASVALSTVSKVLNGRPGIAPETRARVETLLQAHGYTRRVKAQTASPVIEIVFGGLDQLGSIELLTGVERVAHERDMGLFVTHSGDQHAPAPDWIDAVLRRRPAGVILVVSNLLEEHRRRLRSRNIPFVLIDPSGNTPPDVPSIGPANWAGGLLATQHLISLGHRDIGIVGGPEDVMLARARVSGFRAAMHEAAIPVREELIMPGIFSFESGVASGTALLAMPKPPTAIFAISDLLALGAYEAARRSGVRIPDELSVIGFDDLQISAWVGPPLTTIHNPLTEMAEEATRLVIRLRDESPYETIRLDVATTLVVRESTAPVPAGGGRDA
jgi:LacI family transcriptional regulator, xylobiose transport system transcriptional regulator